jgi:hypothetical protein
MEQLSFDPFAPAIARGQVVAGEPVQWQREPSFAQPFPSHVRSGTEVEILEIGESFVVARAHGVHEAQVCRFCGYEFREPDAPQMT